MEHQLTAVQEPDLLKRHFPLPVAAPAFDRPFSPLQRSAGNLAVQRRAQSADSSPATGVPPIVHDVLRSPGQPLDSSTRSFMEPRFGHDFGNVRIHTDAHAAESAHTINASAYTVGGDVVFGGGQYNPHTTVGQRLLAHELTHVVQQGGQSASPDKLEIGPSDDRFEREAHHVADINHATTATNAATSANPAPTAGARLQRNAEGSSPGVLDYLAMSPTELALRAATWTADPRHQQFLQDLIDSAKESPQHVGEFFKDELWAAIKEYWIRIVLVTGGLILAEEVIAALAATPEPTLLTKVVAVILQVLVIAIIGYFAAVEVSSAYDEGKNWFSLAHEANGDPAKVTQASKSFVRMVWHIVMAILAVAGVRARIKGFTVPGGVAAAGSSLEGGVQAGSKVADVEGGAGKVTDISSRPTDISTHPKYVPHFEPSGTAADTGGQTAYYGGSAAPKLDPQIKPVVDPQIKPVVDPQIKPVVNPPPPVPKVDTGVGTVAGKGPGVQPVPAVAVGISAATDAAKKRQCGDPELPWTVVNWSGSGRGERMVANPLTRCGPQGSDPSIHLPGWKCIQDAGQTTLWVHAHLLHGKNNKLDLHGPGDKPENLILSDKSINIKMYYATEDPAITRTHGRDQTLSYTVEPRHMADSGDKRYFADGMRLTLKRIDPVTHQVIEEIYDDMVESGTKRVPPSNCT